MPPLRLDWLKNLALVKDPVVDELREVVEDEIGIGVNAHGVRVGEYGAPLLVISPLMLLILPPARLDRESPSFFYPPPLTLIVPRLVINQRPPLWSVPPLRLRVPSIQMEPPYDWSAILNVTPSRSESAASFTDRSLIPTRTLLINTRMSQGYELGELTTAGFGAAACFEVQFFSA